MSKIADFINYVSISSGDLCSLLLLPECSFRTRRISIAKDGITSCCLSRARGWDKVLSSFSLSPLYLRQGQRPDARATSSELLSNAMPAWVVRRCQIQMPRATELSYIRNVTRSENED